MSEQAKWIMDRFDSIVTVAKKLGLGDDIGDRMLKTIDNGFAPLIEENERLKGLFRSQRAWYERMISGGIQYSEFTRIVKQQFDSALSESKEADNA